MIYFLCDGNYLQNINPFLKYSSLQNASFENNKISNFSNFVNLNSLENLRDLNLSNNPITKIPWYRTNVIKNFLSIIKLDNNNITREERENYTNDDENIVNFIINDSNKNNNIPPVSKKLTNKVRN